MLIVDPTLYKLTQNLLSHFDHALPTLSSLIYMIRNTSWGPPPSKYVGFADEFMVCYITRHVVSHREKNHQNC